MKFFILRCRIDANLIQDDGATMNKASKPEIISLTQEEVEGLKSRLAANELEEADQKIILSILSIYFWLQNQLQQAKLTIFRLKEMFGFKTEKKTLKKMKN